MTKAFRRRQRRALLGYLWWTPLLCAAFAALFVDVWLGVQRTEADYREAELTARMRAAEQELAGFNFTVASRQKMDRLATLALALGLKEPQPGQLQRLVYGADRDAVYAAVTPAPIFGEIPAPGVNAALVTPVIVEPLPAADPEAIAAPRVASSTIADPSPQGAPVEGDAADDTPSLLPPLPPDEDAAISLDDSGEHLLASL
jgi:hypothetical protein